MRACVRVCVHVRLCVCVIWGLVEMRGLGSPTGSQLGAILRADPGQQREEELQNRVGVREWESDTDRQRERYTWRERGIGCDFTKEGHLSSIILSLFLKCIGRGKKAL